MKGIVVGFLMFGVCVLICADRPGTEPAPTAKVIESLQGPALFQAYCAVCHGKEGKGGGPMAMALKANPPDLTRMAARNRGKFPLARVQKIILSGEEIPAGHGTREMPVWGPVFSQITWDEDLGRMRVYNLAKYIESLQRK